jgi:cell wall-associated NlpC family hydrolase/outer membrane murein-binding lipoprotein Lpp
VTDGRKRVASVLATLCITALSGTVLTANPSYAAPKIKDVQARVDTLYHQAEQASERYNAARDNLHQAETRLKALKADLGRQQQKVDGIRKEVAASVVAQYQGQALSSTTQVLLAQDPDKFLNQITTVSEYNDQRSQMMADFALQVKQLEMRREAAKRELGQIANTKKTLGTQKAQIDSKAHQAKQLLGHLKAQAAAAAASRSSTRIPLNVNASGSAQAVVNFAMAQVGDAYVYGAAGPSSWDCSGLTMVAWGQAGVSLPHSAASQQGYGTPVSSSDLQPGDLVFYYHPVSHVGIYIGNGKIVNAENPSVGVTVAPVFSMPYAGAVRLG